MKLLLAHWHCILPVIAIIVMLFIDPILKKNKKRK